MLLYEPSEVRKAAPKTACVPLKHSGLVPYFQSFWCHSSYRHCVRRGNTRSMIVPMPLATGDESGARKTRMASTTETMSVKMLPEFWWTRRLGLFWFACCPEDSAVAVTIDDAAAGAVSLEDAAAGKCWRLAVAFWRPSGFLKRTFSRQHPSPAAHAGWPSLTCSQCFCPP